jgi:hypothetical protein
MKERQKQKKDKKKGCEAFSLSLERSLQFCNQRDAAIVGILQATIHTFPSFSTGITAHPIAKFGIGIQESSTKCFQDRSCFAINQSINPQRQKTNYVEEFLYVFLSLISFLLCADSHSTGPFDSLPKANNSSIPRGERGKLYGALTGNMVHLLSPGSESDATKFTKKHNKAKKRAVCAHRLFCHSEALQFRTPESTTTTAARPPQTDAESRPAIHSLCRLFWHLQSRNYPPEPPAQNLINPQPSFSSSSTQQLQEEAGSGGVVGGDIKPSARYDLHQLADSLIPHLISPHYYSRTKNVK